MPADQIVQLTGTAGLVAVLLYIVKLLWAAHVKADQEKTDLLTGLTAAVNRLADGYERELAPPPPRDQVRRGSRPRSER